MHPVQVSTWKKELQENLATDFATKRDRDPVDHAQLNRVCQFGGISKFIRFSSITSGRLFNFV